MQLSNATILITGAASGIGLAALKRFSSQGVAVVGIDNNQTAIEQAAASKLDLRFCDVRNVEQINELAEQLQEQQKMPDVLVNNAAILKDQTLVSKLGKRIKQHDLQDWQATIDTNLTGTFLCAREFAARWISLRQPGLIINTSSVVRVGNAGQSAYAASKAAIDALTVTWNSELSVHRIRVASIAHGFAQTGMTEAIPKLFLQQIEKRAKVGRFAETEELVHGIHFIIENDYFSGRTLELDGGMRF